VRAARARTWTFLAACLAIGCEADDLGGDLDGGADAPGATGDGAGGQSATCGFVEPEPNDTPEQATTYPAGSPRRGCIGGRSDVDLYLLAAPGMPASGGYFQAALSEVGAGQLEIAVLSDRDDGRLLGAVRSFDEGAPLFVYWAAAPGERYRVSVSHFGTGSAPFAYTLRATFTAVEDSYEPNDVREQSRPLALGVTARPFFFAGFSARDIESDAYDDWYEVELGARPVTVALGDVPADVGPQLRLFDAAGTERGSRINSEPGGTVTLTAPVTAAGKHRIQVSIFSVRPAAAGESRMAGVVPDSFTRPYSLLVSQ
jgi:hypothetical protein